jgi:hypothetical protein
MAMVVMVIVQPAFWKRDLMNVNVTITNFGLPGQVRAKHPSMTLVLARPAPLET